MKKPTPENVRLCNLNAELLKALETARSYIEACAPPESQQRSFVLQKIDVALAGTRNSIANDFDYLYKHALHSERRLRDEQRVTRKALRKIATVAAQALEALESKTAAKTAAT